MALVLSPDVGLCGEKKFGREPSFGGFLFAFQHTKPLSERESALKGKEFAPIGSKFFSLEQTHFQMRQNNSERVTSPKSIPYPFQTGPVLSSYDLKALFLHCISYVEQDLSRNILHHFCDSVVLTRTLTILRVQELDFHCWYIKMILLRKNL